MKLWVFPSEKYRNVEIGYRHRRWAVAVRDEQTNNNRWAKAQTMPPYSRGVFYCSDTKGFVMPFVTRNYPDNKTVDDVWDGTWIFPFEIVPLGRPSRLLSLDVAKRTWPVLQAMANPTHALNGMNGLTAFVSTEINNSDWDLLLNDLAEMPDRFPPPQPIIAHEDVREALRSKGMWPLKFKFTAKGWHALDSPEPVLDGFDL